MTLPYPKTEPKANFPQLEQEILAFWRIADIFHKSLKATESGTPFSFYDGPPFANNLPHLGHLGVSSAKDMVCRYQTMLGRHVVRELGWDCHGLPAELSVEKKHGLDAKKIVKKEGLDKFCDYCRADIMTYSTQWVDYIDRIGRWVDSGKDIGYRTMDRNYMESVLWTIKTLHDRGLLYKDFSVNPFDWKLGTVISNSEASQDYREIIDDAITVWFEIIGNTHLLGYRLLAWTTTPWTLPANQALAVNPKMKYLAMKDADETVYIIAESRLKAYEKQFTNAEKVDEFTGADLVGLEYKPLFDCENNLDETEKAIEDSDAETFQEALTGAFGVEQRTVIPADYVSDSDGTGIVHIAPAFGADDFWAVKNISQYFPVVVNVDENGAFSYPVKDYETGEIVANAGENIFDANPKIIAFLKERGSLVKKEQYKHSYPYGERSGEKLIYRAVDSWYIDVPKIKDALLANNAKVNWTSAGGRFADWIENARPWSISRNRFWGTPLPIWEREGEYKIFGSISELEEFFGMKIEDLHRPTLDKLEKDGWKRIPDVLDCWVESGSMPWASLHYPFENQEKFAATFPADYIIEGQDQTRGWFYSLMVLATALFDKPAFKVVSANGMTVDENKKKMSKRLNNFENPNVVFDRYGADAIRLYLLGSNFLKAEPVVIDKEGKVFNEPIKNILTPLWNAYHFFTLYANAGNIKAKKYQVDGVDQTWFEAPNIMDRYILTELNELFDVANKSLNNYQPDVLVKQIVEFLDILNNWYIRRSKERFWNEEQDAFDALWTVLVYLCRVIAPLAPFVSEYIYRALTGNESVHLQKYPHYTKPYNDVDALLINMRKVQSIVSVGRQLREQYKFRNRLPLKKITLVTSGFTTGETIKAFAEIIKDELNLKDFVWKMNDIDSVADSFMYLITPKIGARLGAELKDIIPAVQNGKYKIEDGKLIVETLNSKLLTLNSDEFETRLTVKPGITGAALPDNTAVVVLDTTLTPELIAEGLANDALRFIQYTRKAMNLDVSDRITLGYSADKELSKALETHQQRIMKEALIVELQHNNVSEYATEIEGHKFGIKITKA